MCSLCSTPVDTNRHYATHYSPFPSPSAMRSQAYDAYKSVEGSMDNVPSIPFSSWASLAYTLYKYVYADRALPPSTPPTGSVE